MSVLRPEIQNLTEVIVGMGAALIEGAPGITQNIHLWFERIDEGRNQGPRTNAAGVLRAQLSVRGG